MMLFLTLATFSQTGGVQMVCRSMTKALYNISLHEKQGFQMLSLCDSPEDVNLNYVGLKYLKAFSYNRLRFMLYAVWKAGSAKTVILAHANLLPLAFLIKLFSPATEITLLAHGKEVWGDTPWWKKRLLNKQVRIWAVSRFTKKVLVEKHRITSSRIQVLNNCLDPLFEVPEQFNKPDYLLKRYNFHVNDKIILTLTRLDRFEQEKGYDLILESLPTLIRDFPNVRYVIAGKASDDEHLRIEAKIRELKLQKHVCLIGFVRHEELTDHHLLSDIFALPSSKEGFGLVFPEAAACGSQVIAGNRDGSADAVLDGVTGCLVDPHSRAEIAQTLKNLLQKPNDPEDQKSRQEIVQRVFSFDKYQENICSLLTDAR